MVIGKRPVQDMTPETKLYNLFELEKQFIQNNYIAKNLVTVME